MRKYTKISLTKLYTDLYTKISLTELVNGSVLLMLPIYFNALEDDCIGYHWLSLTVTAAHLQVHIHFDRLLLLLRRRRGGGGSSGSVEYTSLPSIHKAACGGQAASAAAAAAAAT